ncbi:MAG: hypothetical protein OHK0050_18790 [Roseiflexaceae bacterium]
MLFRAVTYCVNGLQYNIPQSGMGSVIMGAIPPPNVAEYSFGRCVRQAAGAGRHPGTPGQGLQPWTRKSGWWLVGAKHGVPCFARTHGTCLHIPKGSCQ